MTAYAVAIPGANRKEDQLRMHTLISIGLPFVATTIMLSLMVMARHLAVRPLTLEASAESYRQARRVQAIGVVLIGLAGVQLAVMALADTGMNAVTQSGLAVCALLWTSYAVLCVRQAGPPESGVRVAISLADEAFLGYLRNSSANDGPDSRNFPDMQSAAAAAAEAADVFGGKPARYQRAVESLTYRYLDRTSTAQHTETR